MFIVQSRKARQIKEERQPKKWLDWRLLVTTGTLQLFLLRILFVTVFYFICLLFVNAFTKDLKQSSEYY